MSGIINTIFTGASEFMDDIFGFSSNPDTTNSNQPISSSSNNQPISSLDLPCVVCQHDDNHEILLICDGCDKCYHTTCIGLDAVPPGDWFCPCCVRGGKTFKSVVPDKTCCVVIYERVSSAGQNAPEYGRVGLETQRNAMTLFCLRRGIRILHTFSDVGSARHIYNSKENGKKRLYKLAEYGQMISLIEKSRKPVCVLVYSVSRFGRNYEQVMDILRYIHDLGSYVYSISEGVSSYEPKFTQLVRQSHEQSDAISRIVRDSISRRHEQGHFIGVAPYGYETWRDSNGIRRIRSCAAEAEGLRIINQRLSYNIIKDELKRRNIPARCGEWTNKKIENIQKRLKLLSYDEEIVDIQYETNE